MDNERQERRGHGAVSGFGRALLVVAVLLATTPAQAWGPVGHRIVGGIADRLISESTRAQVGALLAGDLDKSGRPSGRTTLEQVATWADEIRSTSANKPLRHFDDIPACGEVPATPTWCPASGECATQKINDLVRVLGDASAATRDRNEALKWIVHLVGDLHQPLHAATNAYLDGVTDDEGNATDRGGNDVFVALAGVQTRGQKKLHGVWDSDFVNLSNGLALSNRSGVSPAKLDRLAQQAQGVAAARLTKSPLDWALESNALARSTAYNFEGFACFEPLNDTVVLDAGYQQDARALVPMQLALAGARLAHLLDQVLGH
ncbi:MAG: S1/P1 nuclease [Proteobacteria bacterium]|nr:S1/P1 nuclease [Pseudomonadota bacterium]